MKLEGLEMPKKSPLETIARDEAVAICRELDLKITSPTLLAAVYSALEVAWHRGYRAGIDKAEEIYTDALKRARA